MGGWGVVKQLHTQGSPFYLPVPFYFPILSSELSVVVDDVGVVIVKTLFYLYCFILHLKNQMRTKWTLDGRFVL